LTVKRNSLRRFGVALGATVVIGLSVPGIAGAQASGAVTSPGVQPVQLPRTGNPDADTGSLTPFAVLGGGLVVTSLVLFGRRQRNLSRRR
jgi:hypothetical protein